MFKYLIIAGLLSEAVRGTFGNRCPLNEQYSQCGNNGCQNTCANPNLSMVCRAMCISGCICIEGYLRNGQGVCVKASECDCGGDPNAVFNECGDTSLTCANKDNPPLRPLICNLEGGCTCKGGYVRNMYGKCIPENKCPKCGAYEVFACGSACDTTCDTLGEQCPIVNIQCNEMCYCIEGYARNNNGVCIPISECTPKQCKDDPNAIPAPCGDPCPTTCKNKDNPNPRPCPRICLRNGCKCKKGYVKGPNNKCILPKFCPSNCKANEVLDPCPPLCPPQQTCSDYISGVVYDCAVPPTNLPCTPACRCQSGYLRNDNQTCVLPEQCCADPNAELVSCPNPCPGGTCISPTFAPCRRACVIYGCQCKSGYVKKSDTDPKCVLLNECKN